MKNGLAIWHYPHRNLIENIEYFAKCGYDSVSVHGNSMYDAICDFDKGELLAETVKKCGVILTVHSALPKTHKREDVEQFKKRQNPDIYVNESVSEFNPYERPETEQEKARRELEDIFDGKSDDED